MSEFKININDSFLVIEKRFNNAVEEIKQLVDSLTKECRSWNMSRIRSKNTKPEKLVRSELHKMGFRFRIHCKNLPGNPDIVLPKYRAVIFVNGCFWHRHKGCRKCSMPSSNKRFWTEKFSGNVKRDKEQQQLLKKLGWKVFVIWECQTKDVRKCNRKLMAISRNFK